MKLLFLSCNSPKVRLEEIARSNKADFCMFVTLYLYIFYYSIRTYQGFFSWPFLGIDHHPKNFVKYVEIFVDMHPKSRQRNMITFGEPIQYWFGK